MLDRLALGVIGRWKWAKQDLRCRSNTWFILYKTIRSRDKERPHPLTFPDLLPEMCIKLHGLNKAKLIFVPFTGLGSTAIACKRLEMNFIGLESEALRKKERVHADIPKMKNEK